MSESSEPGSPKEVPAEPAASGAASSSKALALEAVLDSHTLQATRFKGALHVNFLAAEGIIPRCKQRKGRATAKPLERVNACGEDAKQISSSTPIQDTTFCNDCLTAMRVSEQDVRGILNRVAAPVG